MNKIEFIDMLRRHLSEVSDPVFVNDTIDYYTDYIETGIRKGRSEEDVLAELGDPRLIAKSIVASKDIIPDGSGKSGSSYESYGSSDSGYGDYGQRSGTGIYGGKVHFVTKSGKDISLPVGLAKAGGVAVGILTLVIVGKIAIVLSPVIGVGILAILIYRFFKDNF